MEKHFLNCELGCKVFELILAVHHYVGVPSPTVAEAPFGVLPRRDAGASLINCGARIICCAFRHKIFQPPPLYAYREITYGCLFVYLIMGIYGAVVMVGLILIIFRFLWFTCVELRAIRLFISRGSSGL